MSHALVGEWRDTIGAYEIAASLSRAQQQLPRVALRRIANALYYDSQLRSAAGVLEGLADEAATFGDVEAEFWATIDAAQLLRMAGATAHARRLNERAERLLESGRLAEHAQLRERMQQTDLKVFARRNWIRDKVREHVWRHPCQNVGRTRLSLRLGVPDPLAPG